MNHYKIENRTIKKFCKVQLLSFYVNFILGKLVILPNFSTKTNLTSRVLAFKREIKMFNFLSTSLENLIKNLSIMHVLQSPYFLIT